MSALSLVSQIWQPKSGKSTTLPPLHPARLRACHRRRTAIDRGQGQIPHGQWLLWLKESIAKYSGSAQTYMQIAHLAPDAQRIPRHWSCNHAHD